MKNLGKITDPKDIITKEYIDEGIGKTVNTLEDNVAMAESDIETLQTDVQGLQTDNTATKAAVKTLQDTYVPNTRKVNNKALEADITLTASDVGALENTYKPIFIVNVTPTGNSDDSATADKTYAEVLEAYNNGKSIACLVQNSFLVPLSAAPSNIDERFQFGLTGITGLSEHSEGNTLYIVCSKDGWSFVRMTFSIPTKTSQLTNDSGFLTSAPVTSVNNKTGAVTLTASDVGALPTTHQNVTVATSAWVANTNSQAADQEKTDYPFMATISLTGVTANQMATVLFNYDDQIGGNFAPCAYTTEGGVIIEAKEKPTATITLASVTIMSVDVK